MAGITNSPTQVPILNLFSLEGIELTITVQDGIDHSEGTTATVRIELDDVLPPYVPANKFQLRVSLTGSIRSVVVDGQSHIFEEGAEPFVLDLTEDLRDSTFVDVQFYLADDDFAGLDGYINLGIITPKDEWTVFQTQLWEGRKWSESVRGLLVNEIQTTAFKVIDNDEPLVTVRSLRRAEPAELSGVEVSEGDTVQLEVELTNAPEGGAAEDITVNLVTGNGATASESDYSYPRSVTIPQGQSRVTFEVSALQGRSGRG